MLCWILLLICNYIIRFLIKIVNSLQEYEVVCTIEIKIPKEVRKHQETIFFGLSARQFFCSVVAVGLAVLRLSGP